MNDLNDYSPCVNRHAVSRTDSVLLIIRSFQICPYDNIVSDCKLHNRMALVHERVDKSGETE